MKMKIKITSDSTCDLSTELVEKFNIGIVPLHVIMGGKTYSDGVDVVPEDIFRYVRRRKRFPPRRRRQRKNIRRFFRLI